MCLNRMNLTLQGYIYMFLDWVGNAMYVEIIIVYCCLHLQSSPPSMFIQQVQLFDNAISTAVTNILGLHVLQSVTVRELQDYAEMIMP